MSSDLFKFKFAKSKTDVASSDNSSNKMEKQLTLSDSTFADLRDVIYKLSGIYYTESKKYLLEGRIAKRILANGLKSFEEYIALLKSANNRSELFELFEAITINETYFFRAEQQFDAFEKIIIPEILKTRNVINPNVFRIWSAASSTGEEAYTIAIMVLERIKPMFPHIQFQILASDINNAVLDAARKGLYKEYAIRNIPPAYLNKYFKKQGTLYQLNDEVRRMVKFANINLFDNSQMRSVSGCDVIFCCNVLIYFDVQSKQTVVSHLYDALNKTGYLFIGYSESLHGITKAFKLVHLPKAMAYKKE
jgi:chemotaxis protein methyltransferase CheR